MKRLMLITSMIAVGALGAACGADTSAAPKSAPKPAGQNLDVSVMRNQDFDFEPAKSPEALVKSGRPDAIMAGEVEGIEQGREIFEDSDLPDLNVVMRVKVTGKIRSTSRGQVTNNRVHVELWQGARYNDAAGTPEHSLQKWRSKIPAGTPVMLFLAKDANTDKVRGARNGLPAGAELMRPLVQGLIFEKGNILVGGLEDLEGEWRDIRSIKELTQRVKRQVSRG